MRLLKFYINKCLFFILLVFSISSELLAQQDVQFNQFMFNNKTYNPAFAGLGQSKTLFILYSEQWIGIKGTPKTQVFSYSSPPKAITASELSASGNSEAKSDITTHTKSKDLVGFGFGIGVINDQIGPTSQTTFDLDLSYSISISKASNVAFGIKGSAHILDINLNSLNPDNSMGMDPLLVNNINNQISPNIGAGILYYTNTFFIGLSVPSILETSHFQKSSISVSQEKKFFYITTGFIKNISTKIKLRPSLMIKTLEGSSIKTDIGATFLLAEKMSLGASYRLNAALSGLIGYQFSNPFFVGISYGKASTNSGNDIFGVRKLEVVLKYTFNKKNTKVVPAFLF
jgi:type IX secretion system PorP/SprF family membrane protein